MLGGPSSYDVVRGGVSCELVHLGSLYHDDVMDEADTRRGVETVNAKWGNLQAILAGDFLLARASEIAASLGTEVAGLLARTIGWLCEGQIEELRHTYDITRNEESYLASIHGKTASLYGTAARIGAIVAGHDRVVIDALTEYGNAYGIVFQIVDDILDITATNGELGKPAGSRHGRGRVHAARDPHARRRGAGVGRTSRRSSARRSMSTNATGRSPSCVAAPGIASSIVTARELRRPGGGRVRRHPRLTRHDGASCGAGGTARIRRRPRLTATGQVTSPLRAGRSRRRAGLAPS